MAQGYHTPVLLSESVQGLNIKEGGIYVDATFGGGGHSKEILRVLGAGKLFAFDQDQDSINNNINDNRFMLIEQNFRYLDRFLKLHGITSVDGVLADLGISSHQIDTAERGFSTRFDGPLDMRMNQSSERTAADILNTYNAEKLQFMFGNYGEIRNAKTLAHKIIEKREVKKFTTTTELADACREVLKGNAAQYLSKVFQAIRIEVNQEMDALKDFLSASFRTLVAKGRLVVISYHSLEDRLVKRFMKTGSFENEVQRDEFGQSKKYFELINKKPIVAGFAELKQNPRARSAKMRIAEKL